MVIRRAGYYRRRETAQATDREDRERERERIKVDVTLRAGDFRVEWPGRTRSAGRRAAKIIMNRGE